MSARLASRFLRIVREQRYRRQRENRTFANVWHHSVRGISARRLLGDVSSMTCRLFAVAGGHGTEVHPGAVSAARAAHQYHRARGERRVPVEWRTGSTLPYRRIVRCSLGGRLSLTLATVLCSQLVPEHIVMTKEEVTELLAR